MNVSVPQEKKRGLSVRAKMTLVFIGAILLPLVLTIFAGMRISSQRAQRNLQESNLRALAEVREVLGEFRRRAFAMADFLASSERVKKSILAGQPFTFSGVGHTIWEMTEVEAFDRQGRLLARSQRSMAPDGREAARKAPGLEARADYFRTPNGLVLTIQEPVFDNADREIIGVVVVALPVDKTLIALLRERVGASVAVFWASGQDGASSVSSQAFSGDDLKWDNVLDRARASRADPDLKAAKGEVAQSVTAYAVMPDFQGRPAGVIATAMDSQTIRAAQGETLRLLGISGSVALALAALLGIAIARHYTQPIERMLGVIRRMADGDLGERLVLERKDEFAALADEFNAMAQRLEQERRKLSQSEERYRVLYEHSIEGIFRSTIEGRLVSANPAMARLLGYQDQEDLLASVVDLASQLYVNAGQRREFIERLKRDGSLMDMELLLKRRDAVEIVVSASARIVPEASGEARFIEGSLVDVTARRHSESLERDKIKAEAANRAKSDFLASMSHEIRTPLNVIAGLTEAALEETGEDKKRESLETCHDAASHLLDLVNDIMDFSRIEAGGIELERRDFDLPKALGKVERTMRAQAALKGLAFEMDVAGDVPRVLCGDAARLRQILINLAGNAIKFTQEGRVAIQVFRGGGAKAETPVPLVFTVTDTGPGMAKESLQAVFGQYAQENASIPRMFGGAGLGLTISLKLARLMGGDITVASEKGRGCVFTFTAPFALGDPAGVPSPEDCAASQAAPARSLKILVVEDNPANYKVASLHLARLGHEAALAGNGLEAIELLRTTRFDLILMDLEMPEMNGFEAVRAIRSCKAEVLDPDIPIVVMTAHALSETRWRCLASGMDGFLTKPVNMARLKEAIEQAMTPANEACVFKADGPAVPLGDKMILDERAARRELGVDPRDFPLILDAALREIVKRAELLDEALRQGDFKTIRLQVHTVKGSAATIGARRLRQAAMDVEAAAREEDAVRTGQLAAVFFRERDELLHCAYAR